MTRSALLWRIGSKTEALNSVRDRALRLARARGIPAASARAMAPIRGRLATTWTISALSRRARIRSIRFWSVVPSPETHTASRIGGWTIGGSRGDWGMAQDLPQAWSALAQLCSLSERFQIPEGAAWGT